MRIILSAAFNVYASVGITKYLHRLAEALHGRCELTIMTPEPKGFPDGADIVRIPTWTARNYGRLIWTMTSLRRLLSRQPDTVLLCPTPDTPPRPPLPTISVVHDLIPLILPESIRRRDRRLFQASLRTLRWADSILTDSENTAKDLVQWSPRLKNRVSVCYPGPGIAVSATPSDSAIGLQPYLLYVGGYSPHKNLLRLVSAFAALGGPPGLKLVLVGGEHHQSTDSLLMLASELGVAERIVLLSDLPDNAVSELYRSAELFVFPSLYEGFGLPVLESLKHGTPVACSRTSSLPEVAGSLAVYFDPCDSSAIAQALRYALAHKRALADRIAVAGQQLKTYSWDSAATLVLSTAERLLDKTNR